MEGWLGKIKVLTLAKVERFGVAGGQGFGWKILRGRFHGYFTRSVGVSDNIIIGNKEELSSIRSWSEISVFLMDRLDVSFIEKLQFCMILSSPVMRGKGYYDWNSMKIMRSFLEMASLACVGKLSE